tara:strand:- start:759 stop:893 length:135 start_codon:yes stop_codon:yes gene_type:complete
MLLNLSVAQISWDVEGVGQKNHSGLAITDRWARACRMAQADFKM